ncbi:HAMP domain-containing protein [Deinococcus taeanensis]|uniref:HAMP domain-containing protein n=1 Tax=Deinococcus taeanensis TaxID=2737050 RepID=UPI001CDC2DF6|nr:HAMP domain-containing protein [Deinococcus taeanensis]UBV43482.1 HAMP domain-containing protein [Deinococcus taeanensis]
MKYTVVIRQPVDPLRKPELEEQLRDRFGLNPEQAQRLSDRRTGRLMKPTGRARAELLLSMFQSIGADVSLEEVRDETSVISEPFQSLRPAMSGQTVSTDDALLAPDRAPGSAADSFGALSAPAVWPEVNSVPVDAPFPAFPEPLGAPLPGEFMPGVDWSTPPAPTALGSSSFGGDSASGAAAIMAPPEALATSPFDDPFATLSGSVPSAGAGNTSDPAADVWSDFTGALTLTEAPARPEVTAEVQVSNAGPVVVPTHEDAATTQPRRSSLRRRMAVGALVPLGISSALTLGVLALTLPPLQNGLVQRNAQAVAVAVASNIDSTRGSQSIPPQLEALVNNSSVGFVQVELRDGSRYFASQTPDVNDLLNAEVSNWLVDNAGRAGFVTAISPAKVYRDQATEMRNMGGTANDIAKLDKLAADPVNQRVTKVNFIVQQVTVKQEEGKRVVTNDRPTESDDVLYTVAVGVENGKQQSALRRTLLLVLLVSLAALAIAAYLALRAARAVVTPIEELVRVADAISMGDLSRPVKANRNDEIGDLAQALERMRLSLDSAMERLRRRKRS